MVWNLIGTLLAAWGLLSALWVSLGWLLPGSQATTVFLYPEDPPEGAIARLRWLHSLGLLRGRLILVGVNRDRLEHQYKDLEFEIPEDLRVLLELERET